MENNLEYRKENMKYILECNLPEESTHVIIKRDSYLGYSKQDYIKGIKELRNTLFLDPEDPMAKLLIFVLEEAMITSYNANSFEEKRVSLDINP